MCNDKTMKIEKGNYKFVDPRIEALQDQINNLHRRLIEVEISFNELDDRVLQLEREVK